MGANQGVAEHHEYLQHRSAVQSSYGAPLPEGIDTPMKLVSQSDVGVSFAMLDTSLKGKLNRGQARLWLRSVGWCLPDEELDALLENTPVGREVQQHIREGLYTDLDLKNPDTRLGWWGPEDLIRLQESDHELPPNRGVAELEDALFKLAGSRGRVITRDVLYEWGEIFGRISRDDIDDALVMIGFGAADSFEISDLAYLMLNTAVHPPSSMEHHNISSEAVLARDKKLKGLAKGDRVRILKDNHQSGTIAVVMDPSWSGRIKVRMPDGATKTYLAQEIEKIV